MQTEQGQAIVFETIRLAMKKLLHETFNNNPDVANTVGREISIAIFEKKYYSTLSSQINVGKAKTEQRIKDSNETAGNIIRIAMLMIEKMSSKELVAIMNA